MRVGYERFPINMLWLNIKRWSTDLEKRFSGKGWIKALCRASCTGAPLLAIHDFKVFPNYAVTQIRIDTSTRNTANTRLAVNGSIRCIATAPR